MTDGTYKVSWNDQQAAATATTTAKTAMESKKQDIIDAKNKLAQWVESDSLQAFTQEANRWFTYIDNITAALGDFSTALTTAASLSQQGEQKATATVAGQG